MRAGVGLWPRLFHRVGWGILSPACFLTVCCERDTLGVMNMNKSAVVHARLEPGTKKKAEGVLRRLGLSPTDAIRLFYRQICLRHGLPFRVRIPNGTTERTLEKSRKGEGVRLFRSLDDMVESWEE